MTTPSPDHPGTSPARRGYRAARDQLLALHGQPDRAREEELAAGSAPTDALGQECRDTDLPELRG